MSHEIRSPINSIVGFADMLDNVDNKKTQKEYIDIIKKSANMLTQLIDDILDMTKVEAGKLSINKKEKIIFILLLHKNIRKIKNCKKKNIITNRNKKSK